MKKTTKQKPQDEQSIDILKRVAKRVEDATIDINDMKSDLRMASIRLNGVEHNTKMMKVDLEKMTTEVEGVKDEMTDLKTDVSEIKVDMNGIKNEMVEIKVDVKRTREELGGLEDRLGKRISHVADLITISLSKKLQKVGKRVTKVEKIQQTA